jgi:hypothetical protein
MFFIVVNYVNHLPTVVHTKKTNAYATPEMFCLVSESVKPKHHAKFSDEGLDFGGQI